MITGNPGDYPVLLQRYPSHAFLPSAGYGHIQLAVLCHFHQFAAGALCHAYGYLRIDFSKFGYRLCQPSVIIRVGAAYFYVAGLYAQDPVDIAEQRLLSVYHIYYAGKQLLTFFSGESAVSASDEQ